MKAKFYRLLVLFRALRKGLIWVWSGKGGYVLYINTNHLFHECIQPESTLDWKMTSNQPIYPDKKND